MVRICADFNKNFIQVLLEYEQNSRKHHNLPILLGQIFKEIIDYEEWSEILTYIGNILLIGKGVDYITNYEKFTRQEKREKFTRYTRYEVFSFAKL